MILSILLDQKEVIAYAKYVYKEKHMEGRREKGKIDIGYKSLGKKN